MSNKQMAWQSLMLVIFQEGGLCDLHACRGMHVGYSIDQAVSQQDKEDGKHYSKTCVKRPLSKRPKICFQDQFLLNAGQKYCRMLPLEHSAILSTFIELPFVIKIFVVSIFECPFYIGVTV